MTQGYTFDKIYISMNDDIVLFNNHYMGLDMLVEASRIAVDMAFGVMRFRDRGCVAAVCSLAPGQRTDEQAVLEFSKAVGLCWNW